jgi:CRP/FNR family transcriptional regulator, cyclic AMP receptor protein
VELRGAHEQGRSAGRLASVALHVSDLTHAALARMLGARRPTVSSAVGRLAARGLLAQEHRGAWVLRGDPRDGLGREPGPAPTPA